MNTSGIWLRDNNKQLPTPVILPETFIEHKKKLLNTPYQLLSTTGVGGSNHKRCTLSAAALKTKWAVPQHSISPGTLASTSALDAGSASANEKSFSRKFAFSPPPPSSSILQTNDSESPSGCTHCLLHRHLNNFGGGSTLNTPFASRSMPYKRFKDFNYSTGPINLSKNELDTSLYDSKKSLRFIDQGAFSEVYHAQSRIDGQYYAIKVVNLIQKHNYTFKYNEVQILDHILPHSNIICFYSAWREYDYMFMKTELCLDNFSNLLVLKRIDENELLIFLAHSLSGLQHIHSLNVVHMDVKSSNILLGLDGFYKIADFGLAIFHPKVPHQAEKCVLQKDSKNGNVTEGDSRYMAMELLSGSVSTAVDVFSLGMTLVEALFNINLPVDGVLWHRLRQGYLPNPDFESIDYSPQLYSYTAQMVDLDPALRPTPQELLRWEKLAQALNSKSTYLDTLKPQYEACIASKINSSDSYCSPNHSHNNTGEILTCSTPLLFLPSTKKSRLDSRATADQTNSEDFDGDNINSDVIELVYMKSFCY